MSRNLFILGVFIAVSWGFTAQADTLIPAGPVSGTWAASGSPYLIQGEINVPSGQTLVIDPGVQVIFQGHYKFIVNGLLQAIGTEQDSILFTAADTSGGWGGIRFIYAQDSNQLMYCKILFGKGTGIYFMDFLGGGVYCRESNVSIFNCEFYRNKAHGGGGIFVDTSSTQINISDNLIFNNWTTQLGDYGGGIHVLHANPIISNNKVMNNYSYDGAGITLSYDSSLVTCNEIAYNYSTHGSGGLVCATGSCAYVVNNLIHENHAHYQGGGISFGNESNIHPIVRNNTIINNIAQYYPAQGGGIFVSLPHQIEISNCIVYGNIPDQVYCYGSGVPILSYSNIQGGYPGTGNINADPLFVSGPGGDYYLSQTAAGQIQQSPCVNAGDPASPMVDGTTRTDQAPDLGIVDMGYHYNTTVPPPPPPPVDIAMTPLNPPIVIPLHGGSFSFNVLLTVTADTSVVFSAWTMQRLPNQFWQGPMVGPANLELPAGAVVGRIRIQNVPSTALPGTYNYVGYTGLYDSVKWDSSYFTYEKTVTTGDGPIVSDWLCTGDPFPGESQGSPTPLLPSGLTLKAFPNPFNPATAISLQLTAYSYVRLRVYDTAGREVRTLVDGWREAGSHEVAFDASALPSGIYFARLTAGEFTAVEKLVLLK
ncbi:MAG: T9SS C-terminal target domain-containing protein [Candidatus Zixiibacteriota bacterium]|nr:MAG: T9SS C-terminal target domain-containing protein [candidate division Zixibacteria bacterium]